MSVLQIFVLILTTSGEEGPHFLKSLRLLSWEIAAHIAHPPGRLRRRDLPRPRGARVPAARAADEDERLQGRRAVLPREAAPKIYRQLGGDDE